MCIRDRNNCCWFGSRGLDASNSSWVRSVARDKGSTSLRTWSTTSCLPENHKGSSKADNPGQGPVSYTHLRAHETR
eukprot:815719-Prorocentrum_lima.AAC.1